MNGGVLIMKKYLKEILILLIQLFMFYVFPLFAGPTDVMGMIVLLILATLLLSILIGSISNLKVKYLYPIIIAITFVPSVLKIPKRPPTLNTPKPTCRRWSM